MRKQRTLFQKAYLMLIGALGAASAATILWLGSAGTVPSLWILILVSGIVGALDLAVVQLETATPNSPVFVSTAPGIFIFTVLVLGPYGLVSLILGGTVARWITQRWHQPLGYYFNAIETSITYLVLTAVSLPLRSQLDITAPQTATWLSIVGVLLLYPTITLLFMSLLTSIGSKQPVFEVIKSVFLPTAWVDIIPVSLGLLGAILFPVAPWMLLILILPFILAHRALVAIAKWLTALQQIQQMNEQLEQRVDERTADLKRVEFNREREVTDAVHDLNHNLRTIENAISQQTFDQEQAQIHIQSARDLLTDMLLAAQLRGNALILHPTVTDCTTLLIKVIKQLHPLFLQSACEIQIDLPDEDCIAWCDGERIHRVFQNILHNALTYTLDYRLYGIVRVSLTRNATTILCTVSDNGPGIAPDKIQHLGERFSRLRSGEEHPDGTGIGLSFCVRLLDLSNGHLTIASPGEGCGTTVTIALPRTQALDNTIPHQYTNDQNNLESAVSNREHPYA